jgi:predicted DCC family thiol-disulfide oxidoreductase YuxK
VKQIVFFDGVCNLCNGWIDFLAPRLIKPAPGESVHFASLQGKTARDLGISPELKSILLWKDGKILDESDAVFEILKLLRFPWPLARIFKILPRGFRNAVYRWVARNRYRWFGQRTECRLPTEAERKRFGSLFLE